MLITTPAPITPGPPVPNSNDPETTFDAQFEASLAWQKDTLAPGVNAQSQATFNNATSAHDDALAAEASASAAQAAAASASASANATKWLSGTAYADGQIVWSPITYRTYRRMGAGAGAVDPSADTANWLLMDRSPVGTLFSVTGNVTAVASGTYAMPAAGAYAVALPAAPIAGDWVGFIPPASVVTGQKVTGNGNKIMDKLEDMDIDADGVPFRLMYLNPARGWVMSA